MPFKVVIDPFHWNTLSSKMVSVNVHQMSVHIPQNLLAGLFSIRGNAPNLTNVRHVLTKMPNALPSLVNFWGILTSAFWKWNIAFGNGNLVFGESELKWNGYMTFKISSVASIRNLMDREEKIKNLLPRGIWTRSRLIKRHLLFWWL